MSKPRRVTPPLTWLRAFEAAARHRSFTQAGDELGLTQSAVSQHVRALEAHFGHPLFRRAHRQLHLTEWGRLLLPDITTGLDVLAQATQRMAPKPQDQMLRVATSASIARHLLAPRLAEFARHHPGVAIDLQSTVWPDDFVGSAADIELRFGRAEMVGNGARLLLPSALHAVGTPEIAAKFSAERSNTMSREGSLCLIQPVGIANEWADLLPGAKPTLFVDTHGMAVDLALGGAGAALTHVQISRPAILSGALIALPLPQIPAREGYYIARRDTANPDISAAFEAWLDDRIAQLWRDQVIQ